MWKPLRGVFRFLWPLSSLPAGEVLQLRVCSPRFVEPGPRFLRKGVRRALVQDAFDWIEAEQYCRRKIEESRRRYGPWLVEAWEKDFLVFDPDDG
ncbi:hypothetical protein GCM10023081_17100 [Arthrobacter ginkgonis]|uniref:Uncharacterized protein n=1 Tax=Arthrobacter ginkgonis TaxID=1630594 RepID=A0ABP7C6Z8_9MICC